MDPKPDSEPSSQERPQYEFDETQNQTLNRLSDSLDWVSGALYLVTVIYVITVVKAIVQAIADPWLIIDAVVMGLAALLFFALASWNSKAADAFRLVTETEGRDIDHLMKGLGNLQSAYGLLASLVKVYVALLAVAVVVAVVMLIIK